MSHSWIDKIEKNVQNMTLIELVNIDFIVRRAIIERIGPHRGMIPMISSNKYKPLMVEDLDSSSEINENKRKRRRVQTQKHVPKK